MYDKSRGSTKGGPVQILPWLAKGFLAGIVPWDLPFEKPASWPTSPPPREVIRVRDVIFFLQYADARLGRDVHSLGDGVEVHDSSCFCGDFEAAIGSLQDALVEENPEFENVNEFSLTMLDENLPLGKAAQNCFTELTELFLRDEKLRDN